MVDDNPVWSDWRSDLRLVSRKTHLVIFMVGFLTCTGHSNGCYVGVFARQLVMGIYSRLCAIGGIYSCDSGQADIENRLVICFIDVIANPDCNRLVDCP